MNEAYEQAKQAVTQDYQNLITFHQNRAKDFEDPARQDYELRLAEQLSEGLASGKYPYQGEVILKLFESIPDEADRRKILNEIKGIQPQPITESTQLTLFT